MNLNSASEKTLEILCVLESEDYDVDLYRAIKGEIGTVDDGKVLGGKFDGHRESGREVCSAQKCRCKCEPFKDRDNCKARDCRIQADSLLRAGQLVFVGLGRGKAHRRRFHRRLFNVTPARIGRKCR